MIRYLFIVLVLTVSLAQADPGNRELCEQIASAKVQMLEQNIPGLGSARFELLLQRLFPARSFTLSSTLDGKNELGGSSGGRHMIVSIGVETNDPILLAHYEELLEVVNELNRQLIDLYQRKGVEACYQRSLRIGFSAEHFHAKRSELSNLAAGKRHEELLEVRRYYSKLSRRLQGQWELHTGLQVAELKKLLRSGEVDHLIIVAHATSEGHLVDAFGNFFPTGFFQDIASELKSLSIFSCHGEKVLKTFKLDQNESIKVFYPDSRSPLIENVTLLRALPSFVNQVSKELRHLRLGKSGSPGLCSLKISPSTGPGEGAYLLGDKYLLGYQGQGQSLIFPFNCSLLRTEDMISFRSLNPRTAPVQGPTPLAISTPAGDVSVELLDNFSLEGGYSGSLFMIGE